VHGGRDTDDALKPVLLEAERKCRPRSFGGEAAAPPRFVQLESDLDLVVAGPVVKLIETDPADPGAGRLVDGGPRAESVLAPLSQAAFREPGDSIRRHVAPAPDFRVAEKALKLDAVFRAPGT
jgi:hypothetical protein